jgi:hypothetical protein
MESKIKNQLNHIGSLNKESESLPVTNGDKPANSVIYQTTNLDKFIFAEWNRDVRKEKVISLSERMKNFFLSFTIVVNELLEIIDGQHRFSALKIYNEYRKSIGLEPIPLRYEIKVGWGKEECKELNSETSVFSNEDVLKQELYNNNENYLLYDRFKKEYPFLGHNTVIGLLSGNIKATKGGENKAFKIGTFKVKDYEESVELTNKIIDIVETGIIPLGDRGNPQTTYTLSILPFLFDIKYDHQHMMRQIKNRNKYTKDSLPESTKLTTCKYYLQKLYNHDVDKKDRISILTKTQMYKEELKRENV